MDIEDFNVKLGSLQTKWEGLCPNFYTWFFSKCKSLFIESIIQSARENSDITGLYNQNEMESLHTIEKREQCFKSSAILQAVTHLQDIVIREQNDKIRAIYSAGNYILSTEYKRFEIPSHTWHSWKESRRKDHVTKFYECEPSIDDMFIKPSSSGRKLGCQKRQQNQEAPGMIVDRFSICDENTDAAESENNIASTNASFILFVDPCENIPQEYELQQCSLLPKAISKCQGKCGKTITHSDILIEKPFLEKRLGLIRTRGRRDANMDLYIYIFWIIAEIIPTYLGL